MSTIEVLVSSVGCRVFECVRTWDVHLGLCGCVVPGWVSSVSTVPIPISGSGRTESTTVHLVTTGPSRDTEVVRPSVPINQSDSRYPLYDCLSYSSFTNQGVALDFGVFPSSRRPGPRPFPFVHRRFLRKQDTGEVGNKVSNKT